MNRNLKKFICIFAVIGIIIGTCFFIKHSFSNNNDSLININDLSNEFIDNYFEEYSELSSKDKENTLIVISSDKIDKKDYGAKEVIEAPNNNYYLVFEDELSKNNAFNKLKDEDSVKSVEENIVREFFVDTGKEEISYNSWGIEKMGLDYAMDSINDLERNQVVVGIIDTGLDVGLFNKYYSNRLIDGYNSLSLDDSMYDNFGHGTHIAGTIAEGTPSNVKIMPIKASDGASLMETDILAAFDYATLNGVDVLNLSFGSYQYSDAEYQRIKAATEKGIVVVAAAGNENTSELSYPAAFDNTISIASVDSNLEKSYFSNYGNTVDFAAPGGGIKSILASYMSISVQNIAYGINDNDDDFETISGTSMATPHAVCAVAILKTMNKNIDLEGTKELLKATATDLGGTGYDIYFGNGFIDFNNQSFCLNDEMACDNFKVFKVIKPTSMAIDEVVFTNYNYGSITNILDTEVSFTEVDGFNFTKKLWELDNLEIIGYDAYSKVKQNVTIKYNDLELKVDITNPSEYPNGFEYEKIEGKYYLTKYKEDTLKIGKLYLPSKVDGYTINAIKNSTGNTSILFNGLNDTSYIKEIYLPTSITYIGSYAFSGLDGCTKVISAGYDDDKNINVGKYAFADMPVLTTVKVKLIFNEDDVSVFENDTSLKDVTISSITSTVLPESTFQGCTSLESVYFPSPIQTIGAFAFESSGLKSVVFPDSLTSINTMAFANTKLSNVVLPDTLTKVGPSAFMGANLKSVFIPTNVNEIGEGAFAYNPELESIVVKDGNSIYTSGTNGNVIIEKSTNTIIQGSNKANIPSSVITIGAYSFAGLNIKELTIPFGVEKIDENAFYSCGYLEKVVLPMSINNIDLSNFRTYQEDNDKKLLYTPLSGAYTGIGNTVLWVDKNSYGYNFAIDNNLPYVLPEPSEVRNIINFTWLLKKQTFNPGDKFEDYVDYIKYFYFSNDDILEDEVKDYEIVYQHGDSLTLDDYYVYIKFSFKNSYQNVRLPIYVNVQEKSESIDLPAIETIMGDYICKYEYPNGTFTPYGCIIYDEPGEYKVTGDYVDKDGKAYYSIEVNVKVLNKELVNDFAQTIISKKYDGKTSLDPNSITLSSYKQNIKQSDYTVISAELSSPDVGKNKSVTIKVKINDDSFDKFAFAGNKQELEFTGTTSVYDFDVPTANLLVKEPFYEVCIDEGCFRSYGSPSYDTAGDYEIIGYFNYNNSPEMIENIPIPIHVINKEYVDIFPKVEDKEYDGTTNIDFDSIIIDGLDKENYTITLAQLGSPNVNDMGIAYIKVKLSDEYYETHAFSEDKQEEEFYSPVTLLKANPEYSIPNDLEATIGQMLYDITLPDGFEWVSEDQELNEVGTKEFIVKYTPEDTNNYNVVENIKVNVEVSLMKYTITFHPNGGKESSYTQELEDNIETKLDKNTFTKEGYDFVGWNTKEDGSGTSYEDEELVGISEDLDLYAQWIENYSYVIDYKYNDTDKIIEVDLNTKVEDFKKNIKLNDKYKVEVESKKVNDEDVLYTGGKIKIYKDEELYMEYSAVVKGDVNGDSKINYLDYVVIYNHIQKVNHPDVDKKELLGAYLFAADMSGDDKVNYLDYVKVYNKIKEMKGEE